jgi:molybdate transport system substrate-binding protein
VNDLTIRHFLDKDSIFAWGYGQLVVVMPLDGDPAIETLMDAERIAIANPETAPYGAAAKQLMQQNNVWDQVEGSFVFAETALQALLFAQAGEVDFAFVPLSLVRADGDGVRIVEQSVRFNDFGQRLPEPISLTQALAVVADSASSERARRFVEFFATNDVIELMRSLGYTPVIELMRGSDAR